MNTDWFQQLEYVGIHRITPDWSEDDVIPPQGVRLWCTAGSFTHGKENARFELQIRGFLRRQNYTYTKTLAFGSASMSRADLRALRKAIDRVLDEDGNTGKPRSRTKRRKR